MLCLGCLLGLDRHGGLSASGEQIVPLHRMIERVEDAPTYILVALVEDHFTRVAFFSFYVLQIVSYFNIQRGGLKSHCFNQLT